MKNLIHNLFNTEQFGILENNLSDAEITIYAPAIDRYWCSPLLDENLKTLNVQNCYVIGDAVGKSRGIFQAMFSGIMWANKFYNELVKKKFDDKVWSSRVSTSLR